MLAARNQLGGQRAVLVGLGGLRTTKAVKTRVGENEFTFVNSLNLHNQSILTA